jgi:serine/threonine protein phosphatase PrpC
MDLLVKRLNDLRPGTDLRETILSTVEAANLELLKSGTGAATTCALVEIHGDRIRPYHVGDSAILVTGNRGKLKLETVSHSPTGYAVESGLLSESEAIVHEERHLVSNIVGTPEMHISIGSSNQLCTRDTLLLATDGLFDNLHKNEIIERMRKGPLAVCMKSLANLAFERMTGAEIPGKPDDLSFVLFRPRSN